MEFQTKEFVAFAQRRKRLNERLDSTRRKIDQLVDTFGDRAATMSEMALFQGLLEERAKDLEALAKVDEDFLGHLLSVKFGEQARDGHNEPKPRESRG